MRDQIKKVEMGDSRGMEEKEEKYVQVFRFIIPVVFM
jgi:hypothetical protein